MSNFLRSLFGDKKSAKSAQFSKSKMLTKRLELIGLEERITPVITATLTGTVLDITTTAGEDIVSIVSASSGVITINATTAGGTALAIVAGAGVTVGGTAGANTLTLTTPANLTQLSLVGDAIGSQDFTITGINSAAYSVNFGLSVDMGADILFPDALNFTTAAVTLKGTGALVTKNIDAINIASAGGITAATGAVGISATNINIGGNITTTSGAITFNGDVFLSDNFTTLSTLAGGNFAINGALALAGFNFTANQGLGNVDTISQGVSGIGSLTLTGVGVTVGAISITGKGELNATATNGDLTFLAPVSAPTVIATSLQGNVVFSNTVASTVGKIEVSAVTPTKAISIANTVTGANNANITLNGDVLSNHTTAAKLISSGTGDISIVGKVSASAIGNDFGIEIESRGSGAVSISGVVDGTIGDFEVKNIRTSVEGQGTLNLSNNITTVGKIILDVRHVNLMADVSLKTTGIGSVIEILVIDGAKKLTLETPADLNSAIILKSVGHDIALDTVTVVNSGYVFTGDFYATNVVLMDTVDFIAFGGATGFYAGGGATKISSLKTADKGYDVVFQGITELSGAPVFLNTGDVEFYDSVTLTDGATIIGSATSKVLFGDGKTLAEHNIISDGPFNIGALPTIIIGDGTNFFFNSATAVSTFAGKLDLGTPIFGNSFSLSGVGTLTLAGDSSDINSFVANVYIVNDGTLNVTGNIRFDNGFGEFSNVYVGNNCTISGPGGTIGNLYSPIGTIAPGGTLSTGFVLLNSSTNYNVAVLSNSTAANLRTSEGIALGSANLKVTSAPAGLAVGNVVTIIDNTAPGTTLVDGIFFNQPEGSTISGLDINGNTVTYTISYKGGTDANDVTLTVNKITSATPTPTATAQPMVAGQPALNKFTAIGADAGDGPLVTITFQNGTYVSFLAYASNFTGGVRVALGDVNGDGARDIITGAGPGGGPQVNVYNLNNATGAVTLQSSFFAFNAPNFSGGVYVATGDTNDDGFDDVIVGAGATGGSRVQVYAGSATGVVNTSTLNDFFAYSPAFTGGVVVAAGQRDAVAGDEVITGPASNGGYNIKSFDTNGKGNTPTVVDNFFAFNNFTSVGGLSLAVGLLNSDSIADLIVGTSNGGYGVIVDSNYSGITAAPFARFPGALRAGVAEDSFGQDYAVLLAGPTGGPRIKVFSLTDNCLVVTDNLFVMDTAFRGGLFGTPSL